MNKNVAVYDNTVNARTYISYIAEQAGGFACIGRDGKLYIKTIGEETINLDIEKFQDFTWGEKFKVSRVAYEDGIRDFKFGNTTNNTVWINQENMYIVDSEQVENIYNELANFECYSFEGNSIIDPAIDVGDIVVIDSKRVIFQGDMEYLGKFKASISSKIQSKSKEDTMTRIPSQKVINRRVESRIDQQDGIIEQTISEVSEQNTKISRVQQTVDELNSKISDIADITTSQESNTGSLTFEDINQSEPIHIEIMPLGDNISYLYPSEQLYPADNLYIKLRTLRFTNTETNEVFDYELPDDLLYYDNEHYDKFILDYDSQTCYVNKKCAYDNNGNVICLTNEVIRQFTFPHISLTDGDYTVQILKYDNVPYGAYLFCRLMTQNIYTTQFATKAELNSEISQTSQAIDLSVDQKLTNYSTTSQMNSAINMKANEITSSVNDTLSDYSTTTQMNSAINQKANQITSSVNSTLSNYSTTTQMNSAINQKANQITSTVSSTYATKTQLNTAKSEINQTTNSISATVAQNNTKANIIAKINDNTSSAKIDADVVELTANDILNLIAGNTINLSSKNIIISSDTTKITGSGQKFFNNGTQIGEIGTNQYAGDNSQKGLTFDLDVNGRYMAWAKKESSSSSSYIVKLYYCSAYSFGNSKEGVYLGTDFLTKGNKIYLGDYIYVVDSTYSGSGERIFKISDNGNNVALFSRGQNNLYADLYINGAIVQTQTSDGRLKHDIQSCEINAIDRIMQIKHRMFKWNKDNKEEQIGYIAQELEEIDPNYVIKNPQYDEEGEIIDYLYQVNILPILSTCTKAIQELKEENDKYKNLIAQIAEKLDIKEDTKKSRVSQTKGASEKIDFGNVIQYSRNVIEKKENKETLVIDKDGIVRKEEKK